MKLKNNFINIELLVIKKVALLLDLDYATFNYVLFKALL